jgi:hypothetical protein
MALTPAELAQSRRNLYGDPEEEDDDDTDVDGPTPALQHEKRLEELIRRGHHGWALFPERTSR